MRVERTFIETSAFTSATMFSPSVTRRIRFEIFRLTCIAPCLLPSPRGGFGLTKLLPEPNPG
jgi:hypothetical protein